MSFGLFVQYNMYAYSHTAAIGLLRTLLEARVTSDVIQWLAENAASSDLRRWHAAFAATPRNTGKAALLPDASCLTQASAIRKQWNITHWTVDQAARVFLLLHLDATDQSWYHKTIENLFRSAEMNELVALYSALPLYAYPEQWKNRCAEGIRSNIALVLETIMCDNPYPSEYLDEAAWNQLVLKAFFTEKTIHRITGLDQRCNERLADTLFDYVHERWAAGRTINTAVWRCVYPFLNDERMKDIRHLAASSLPDEQRAAALVCARASFAPARHFLHEQVTLQQLLTPGLRWEDLS